MMATHKDAELDVDVLMGRIRAELAERRGSPAVQQGPAVQTDAVPQSSGAYASVRLSRLRRSGETLPKQSQYDLDALLAFQDEDFVRTAYLALLGRLPDVHGGSHFLTKLRTGALSKTEVLGRIRYSPEGRAAGVKVNGLVVPFGIRTLRRIPVLGYPLGVVQYFLRLPTLVRNLERLEAVVFQHRQELGRDVNGIELEIENAFHAVQAQTGRRIDAGSARVAKAEHGLRSMGMTVESLASHVADKVDRQVVDELARASGLAAEEAKTDRTRLEAAIGRVGADVAALRDAEIGELRSTLARSTEEIAKLQAVLSTVQEHIAGQPGAAALVESVANAAAAKALTHQLETDLGSLRIQLDRCQQELIDQQRRLSTLLDEARSRLPTEPLGRDELETFAKEREHVLDGIYLALEDRFRGTREDIMQRVSVYLPHVRNAGAGTASAPVLDIGCGRGEWLEVLSGQGLVGQGVDSNRFVTTFCRERGLPVVEADALAHLRTLRPGSLGAITAIHVIEHLTFEQMIALFDEARRVLKAGGVAIFETPNPENVIVGACNFHYDPSHVKPLPPELMRFLLSQRGFSGVELLRLHPRDDLPPRSADAGWLESEVRQRFFGEQDYAVIGYKSPPA